MKTLRPAHALSLLVLRFVHGKAARLAVWRYPRNKNAGIRTALAINANLQSNLREFESALWERKRVFHTVNCKPDSIPTDSLDFHRILIASRGNTVRLLLEDALRAREFKGDK